ncbi:ATP-binding protein [Actinomycetota bacterium Odt1-20B]
MAAVARTGTHEYQQRLTAHPEAVGQARRIVAAHLRLWGLDELTDAVSLCLSEMITNVREHAESDDCVLLLQNSSLGVRVVVSDDSAELPVVREPESLVEGGRGLLLLSAIADAWGATPTGEGKDVWAEFRPGTLGAV